MADEKKPETAERAGPVVVRKGHLKPTPPGEAPQPPVEEPPPLEDLNIPAKNMAAFEQPLAGALESPSVSATSQGKGEGGGAGTGTGSGIGPGTGSGLGPGFGGGTGGGRSHRRTVTGGVSRCRVRQL